MSNEGKEVFEMLKSAYERFIFIILIIVFTFVLLFLIVIQKPEILTSVIEKLTELIKTSGLDLDNIITTIILSKHIIK